MNYRILNSKDIKELVALINSQFGSEFRADYIFMQNKEGKVNIATRDVGKVIDVSHLRINSIGMYIGQAAKGEFRPSIEGAQLIAKTAQQNLIELDDPSAKKFLKGENVVYTGAKKGYCIIVNSSEVIGTGRPKDGMLLNFNPKTRRILAD